MGHPQEQTEHELRQAEPSAAVLLREGHHQEGDGTEVRVPVRLVPGDNKDGKQDPVPREDGDARSAVRLSRDPGGARQ